MVITRSAWTPGALLQHHLLHQLRRPQAHELDLDVGVAFVELTDPERRTVDAGGAVQNQRTFAPGLAHHGLLALGRVEGLQVLPRLGRFARRLPGQ
ncbi:MAG: hypothetical protein M5U09_27595 [Gammaproteobacteria bacterium]|nr:hypothetical protein [Gammaproteobacteria bacterium]